jgi:hypothetical protein
MAKTPGQLKSISLFTGDMLAIAVAPSRPEVLTAINTGLKSAIDNFLVADIIDRWFAVPPDERPEGLVWHSTR